MAMLVASIVAIYLGAHLVTFSVPTLAVVIAGIFVISWCLMAGNYWWITVLAGGTILGIFKVGVKVSPTQVAFALSVLALVPLILVQNEKAFQPNRKRLPIIFYVTFIYFLIRLLIDVIPAAGARGNLGRVTFDAVWPFMFSFLFYHYGSLSVGRAAVMLMFGLLCIRCAAAMVGYVTGIPLYIPGIDYVLSFSDADSLIAMRVVALNLMLVSLVLLHCSRSQLAKVMLGAVTLAGAVLVIMGASRYQAFIMFTLPVAFFAWSRHWVALALAFCLAVGTVGLINVFPESLRYVPPVAERSLAGLVVVDLKSGVRDSTKSSDQWHDACRAEGFRRWTQSPVTILFGYGIRPSPDLYEAKSFAEDPKEYVELAANTGSYESALWTMLACTGLVGFGLYILLFLKLWGMLLPYLLKKPHGAFWEGMAFWSLYISVVWLASVYFSGGFPALELVLLVMAWAAIQEGMLAEEVQPDLASLETPRIPQLVHSRPRIQV